jgi:hypothetical protein
MAPKDNERLARIETKLDATLAHLGDHESRIRSVEKAWWKQSAIIGALIASISWFGPVIRKHIFGS